MRIGIATIDITPRWPVWLDGFASRERPAEGVAAPVEASAVVLDNGSSRLGLMAIDICAVDDYLLVPIREAASELGIPPTAMMVNTSHNHTGPNASRVRGFCRQFDDAYLEELVGKLRDVLTRAVGDLRERSLEYSEGSCTMGVNRRRTGPSGQVSTGPTPDKPIDPAVPVLRVLEPGGSLRAVIFGYACHPSTTTEYKLSPEFPGYARSYLAERFYGVTTVFLQGCGGDIKPRFITPDLRFAYGPFEAVAEFGRELGRAVAASLCGRTVRLGEELGAASEIVEIPFDHQPTESELQAAEQSGHPQPQLWAAAVRATLARDGKLRDSLPVEMQVLNLGGLHLLGIAAEVCVGIGLRAKADGLAPILWPMGYCNGSWDYIAPASEYSEGGYEVHSSHMDSLHPFVKPLGLVEAAEDILLGRARALIASLGQQQDIRREG